MGKWVTINGTHVYIEKGQSVEDALSKLSEKPKREKLYSAKLMYPYNDSRVIRESEKDKYKQHLTFDTDFEELDLSEDLDYIDSLDSDRSIEYYENLINMKYGFYPRHVRYYLKQYMYEQLAEKQQASADRFLSQVPTVSPELTEECMTSVNQDHYNWSKSQSSDSPDYAAYTYNCQRCAQAFILRWCYGYDVTARPCEKLWNAKKRCFEKTGDDIKLNDYAQKNKYGRMTGDLRTSGGYNGWDRVIFNRQDVRHTLMDGEQIAQAVGYSGTEDQLRYIKRKVKESGDGSAWVCSVCWKGTRTDTGNYDAHVFCIINDGGKVKFIDPQSGEECSKYFTEKQIVPKKTELFRADTCRLNGTMMKEVVTYDKSI